MRTLLIPLALALATPAFASEAEPPSRKEDQNRALGQAALGTVTNWAILGGGSLAILYASEWSPLGGNDPSLGWVVGGYGLILGLNPLAVSGVVHALAPPQRRHRGAFFRSWAFATIGAGAILPFTVASRLGRQASPVLGDALGVPAVLLMIFGTPAGAMLGSWTARIDAEVAVVPRRDGAMLTLSARF